MTSIRALPQMNIAIVAMTMIPTNTISRLAM